MDSRYALDLAGLAGTLLLKSGAEIFRIQETMIRILNHCGYPNHNVYVISNGIFATVNEGQEDRCTLIRHVPLGSVHLDYISEVNEISRELESNLLTPEEASDRLHGIHIEVTLERKRLITLACGVGSAAFCYMFGGSLLDALFALLLGVVLQLFLFGASGHMPKFLACIGGSLLVTLGSAAFAWLCPQASFDNMVIGSIIPLVPGVSFTTSIREFFNEDYLSGIIHLVNALLTAVCIAAGVGGALLFARMIGGMLG